MSPTTRTPDINERVQHGELPTGVEHQRTTDDFTDQTVPAGLLRAHKIAPEVWGRLVTVAGTVRFVWEDSASEPVVLGAGDSVVIPPDTPHHVEPQAGARFHVEFYR